MTQTVHGNGATPDLAALRWVLVSASNMFERVSVSQPVSLSGSGILLYPNLDPKGLLACHFVVVESESKTRHLGKVLEEVLGDDSVKAAVDVLANAAAAAAGGVPGAAAAAVMRALVSVLPKVLQKKRDRIWFTHDHSGFDFDAYGLPADVVGPPPVLRDPRVGGDGHRRRRRPFRGGVGHR